MNDWISVKDNPPPDGWLILAYRYNSDPSLLRVDFGLHVDGEFTSPEGVKRDVTHWMYLPNPPSIQGAGEVKKTPLHLRCKWCNNLDFVDQDKALGWACSICFPNFPEFQEK